MALILKACLIEGCNNLSFEDTTGIYNVDTNPGGYGAPNPTGPADFDSYTLTIWDPSKDYYATTPEPTIVIDLQAAIPTPDAEGHYTWTFTAAQLGLTTIPDGVWYYEAVANTDTDEYTVQGAPIVTATISALLDTKMKKWVPGCEPCGGKGCLDPGKLFMALHITQCGGTCDLPGAAYVIKYLQSKVKLLC